MGLSDLSVLEKSGRKLFCMDLAVGVYLRVGNIKHQILGYADLEKNFQKLDRGVGMHQGKKLNIWK